ncbi:MAG TPA: hypothetical protein VMN39_01215 [Longimicrobiaceae bacterium]|nr:hypothetical protein [Longimicrobiaceae bacterium]
MAERNEKVQERVRQELSKNPGLGSRELYELAQSIDKSIGGDTLQQFHARYVLPVKREQASKGAGSRPRKTRRGKKSKAAAAAPKAPRGGGGTRPKAVAAGTERDHVRAVLLRFAQDFSAAESKPEIVKVMSRLDDYVDQITGRTG